MSNKRMKKKNKRIEFTEELKLTKENQNNIELNEKTEEEQEVLIQENNENEFSNDVEVKKEKKKDLLDAIIKKDLVKINLANKFKKNINLNEKKDEKNIYDENVDYNVDNKGIIVNKNNKKKKKIFLFSFISIIVIIIISFSVFVISNKLNSNVYKNIKCLDVDFSNKTASEVSKILEEKSSVTTAARVVEIYQKDEKIYTVKSEEVDLGIDVEQTSKKILEFGRNGNILENSYNIFKNLFVTTTIEPIYKYNEEKLDNIVKNIDLSVKDRFVDDSYNVDEKTNKIIIKRGTSGNTIDYDKEKIKIFEALSKNKSLIEVETITKKPAEIDVDKIYSEVKKDPTDAYMDRKSSPVKFVNEKTGYDFDKADLTKILNQEENKTEGKVIEYSLTVLQPKIKLTDITYTLYKDKLSGYTTYFDPGGPRANNLNIALNYLNDKIVMPGETFSYNQAIGDTTASKGYKEAATFKAGKVVMEMGGGICQTTSTLYNVALMANMEIVERHQHGLPVGYVPPSRDATVYSPVLDFKFKNTRNYPVKIVTSFSSSGSLNISIFGTKEETEYEISLSSNTLSTIPFTVQYVNDNTIPAGQQVVSSPGVNGYTSEAYITKKLNGTVVSQKLLSKDSYSAQPRVIKVGVQ